MPADRDAWSLNVGSLAGIRIRIHLFLLLSILLGGYVAWVLGQQHRTAYVGWFLLAAAVYGLSLVAHELGHVVTTLRLGGEIDGIVLGPLGGMHSMRIREDPQSELVAHLSGPMVSLFVALVCLAIAGLYQTSPFPGLLSPSGSAGLFWARNNQALTVGVVALRLGCWFNLWLAFYNLIPALPFDGGRAAVCCIALARPTWHRSRAVALMGGISRVVTLALLIAAIFSHGTATTGFGPHWLVLTLLAIFTFFSARREEAWVDLDPSDMELLNYELDDDFANSDRMHARRPRRMGLLPGMIRDIRRHWRARKLRIQARNEKQLDEVLRKLHASGRESLTAAERTLLLRASHRYRKDSRAEKP